MSCYNCASKFNWRRKELECRNCLKAVCKNCLSNKMIIPKLGQKETLVCTKCFNNFNKKTTVSIGKKEAPPSYDEPSMYFGPSMKDIVTSKVQPSDPDAKLRERLKNLKEEPCSSKTNKPSQVDIENRFSELTGRNAASSAGSNNINTPQPKLTEADEVYKLLKQTKERVTIDSRITQNTKERIEDMERRFLLLKGLDPDNKTKPEAKNSIQQGYIHNPEGDKGSQDYTINNNADRSLSDEMMKLLEEVNAEVAKDKEKAGTHEKTIEEELRDIKKRYSELKPTDNENKKEIDIVDSSSEDDEDEVDRIIKQCALVPSSNPSETVSYRTQPSQVTEPEEEELPWCVICNDDAVLRCRDCEDDLYCRRCYKECHDDYETKRHSSSMYQPKSKRVR